MVDSYLLGDLQALSEMAAEQMEALDAGTREYFELEGIVKRNHRMLASMLTHLAGGKVFVAVGALHLPGDQGLLSLLRKNGFTVEPLQAPFSVP